MKDNPLNNMTHKYTAFGYSHNKSTQDLFVYDWDIDKTFIDAKKSYKIFGGMWWMYFTSITMYWDTGEMWIPIDDFMEIYPKSASKHLSKNEFKNKVDKSIEKLKEHGFTDEKFEMNIGD